MGRQHQGMDRPGVRQVPEGSEELGKMEEAGCEVICGAPTTLAVKGYMMMMMMPTSFYSVHMSISVFMALSTVFHFINAPDNSPLSPSVFPVLCLPYWSFQLYLFMKVSLSHDIILRV